MVWISDISVTLRSAMSRNVDITNPERVYLVFSTSTEYLRLAADSVVYATADGNYSIISTADGARYLLTQQIGQLEARMAEMLSDDDMRFLRIGKSLIINREFITLINPSHQKLMLSDNATFRFEVAASKDALKKLKEYLEMEVKL